MRRHALLALTLAACGLLGVAEFSDLNAIQIITVTKPGTSVGAHHGYALLIIAVAAALMAIVVHRSGRLPGAVAIVALGGAALLIVLAVDAPDVHEAGLYRLTYERARAVAETGFRLEAAGAVLLLFSGASALVLTPRRPRPQRAGSPAPAQPS